jgi:hypothetical protein
VPDHALEQGAGQDHRRVVPGPVLDRARGQIDDLELAPFGVEQGHADRVESHEPGRSLREGAEHVVRRLAPRTEPGDLGDHRHPERVLVQAPHALDGDAQLPRKRARQRAAPHARPRAEQGEGAHRRARRPERRLEERPGGAAAFRLQRPDAQAAGRARHHDAGHPFAERA